MLGSLLTTVTSLPSGMLGWPPPLMGMVTVPGELLVTTTTCPAVFWNVACAPTPFKTAAVGVLLPSVWNCTEELEVAAQANQKGFSPRFTRCYTDWHVPARLSSL